MTRRYTTEEQQELADDARRYLGDALDAIECLDVPLADAARFDAERAAYTLLRIKQYLAESDPHLSCERCNFDRHTCHGCGRPLPHGAEVCEGCREVFGLGATRPPDRGDPGKVSR